MPTPIIYNVSDLFDKDDKIASSLFIDNNIIGNNNQTQLQQVSQPSATQQSQQSSLPPGILAEITGDYRNYHPKPPKPEPTWGEKYLDFMNDNLGAASPYATQFVSNVFLGYPPAQPLPEDANTFEKIGAAAASLSGMAVNMAVLPYGKVAGAIGRVLEGSRLPTEFISQLMGKSNAVSQGVKTFGEGLLYGAAEHKRSPEESRLWNAMTTGGTFAFYGLGGGAMEDVGKYVSPTIKKVFSKIKNEEPLTKSEAKILKAVQGGEAIVLGGAAGATQPAKNLDELAQNIIVGAGSFGAVHGVTGALSRTKNKGGLTEEEINISNAEPADNLTDLGSSADWKADKPEEGLNPIDEAPSATQALKEFERINTDTLDSLKNIQGGTEQKLDKLYNEATTGLEQDQNYDFQDVPFDVRANRLLNQIDNATNNMLQQVQGAKKDLSKKMPSIQERNQELINQLDAFDIRNEQNANEIPKEALPQQKPLTLQELRQQKINQQFPETPGDQLKRERNQDTINQFSEWENRTFDVPDFTETPAEEFIPSGQRAQIFKERQQEGQRARREQGLLNIKQYEIDKNDPEKAKKEKFFHDWANKLGDEEKKKAQKDKSYTGDVRLGRKISAQKKRGLLNTERQAPETPADIKEESKTFEDFLYGTVADKTLDDIKASTADMERKFKEAKAALPQAQQTDVQALVDEYNKQQQEQQQNEAQNNQTIISKGFYIRDTFVSPEEYKKLSKEKQEQLLDLKKRFDKLGYIDVRTELGPDQINRMSKQQKQEIQSKTLRAQRIEDQVKQLLKSEEQLNKENKEAEIKALKSSQLQLQRHLEDLETIYKKKLNSNRDNAVKKDYAETQGRLTEVLKQIETLTSIKESIKHPAPPTSEDRKDTFIKKNPLPTREEYIKAHPEKDDPDRSYDDLLEQKRFDGLLSEEDYQKLHIYKPMGLGKELYAQTREEIKQHEKQVRKELRKKPSSESALSNWRKKVNIRKRKESIESSKRREQQVLDAHKEIIKEALLQGKNVPETVLEDYPGLREEVEKESKTRKNKNKKVGQQSVSKNKTTSAHLEQLNSLNPTGTIFTDYSPEKINKLPLGENITTLDKTLERDPDEIITIYRGASNNQKEIVPGDFITTNKQLAKDYAGTGRVLQKKVKLKEVLDDKTEPLGEEYIYRLNVSETNILKGKEATVHVTPETPIKIKYDVVEAKDLKTSHNINGDVNKDFPKELQPRDRSRVGSILQVNKISQTLNPELLGETPDAGHGAPIVSPDSNNVEVGHGRTLAIQRAYEKGKRGTEYKKWLEDNAEEYGPLKEKINSMEQPVLIRRRVSDIEDLADYVQKANESDLAKMSITEQAKVDSDNLTQTDLSLLNPSQEGDLTAASNKAFISRFLSKMSESEQAGYVTEDGKANKQLVDRMQAAVFHKAYGSDRLLKLVAEEANPDTRNILNALQVASKEFAKAHGIDSGITTEIGSKPIIDAIDLIKQAQNDFPELKGGKDKNKTMAQLNQFLKQGSMFEKSADKDTERIALFIAKNIRSGKKLGEFFKNVGEIIKTGLQDKNQPSLFEDTSELSKQTVIDLAFKRMEDKYNDNQGSFFGEYDKQETKKTTPEFGFHGSTQENKSESEAGGTATGDTEVKSSETQPPPLEILTKSKEELFQKYPEYKKEVLEEEKQKNIKQIQKENLLKKIDSTIKDFTSQKDDWASRVYKKNNKKVSVGGTRDDLNAGETTIVGVNERRRQKKIKGFQKVIKELRETKEKILAGEDNKKILEQLLDSSNAELASFAEKELKQQKTSKLSTIEKHIRLQTSEDQKKIDGEEGQAQDSNIKYSKVPEYKPKKTKTSYKLFRTLKSYKNKLFPIFIGKTKPTPQEEWIKAEFIPTKGYAPRPGWHSGILPIAPHLRQKSTGKINPLRVWAEIEIPDDKDWQSIADKSPTKDIREQIPENGHYKFKTNKMQGGAWHISGAIKIKRILSDNEVKAILTEAGYPEEEIAKEMHSSSNIFYSRENKKPWPKDFPNAMIHTSIKKMKSDPDYIKAKAGDIESARRLVTRLIKPKKVLELLKKYPNAIVVAPHSKEATGENAIPRAIAEAYRDAGFEVNDDIIQINTPKRTKKSGFLRLAARPIFDGHIEHGKEYILIDDAIGQGGTLSELRHYIENKGGKVVSISTLTSGIFGAKISIRPETIKKIVNKFGRKETEDFLNEFNIAGKIEALTEKEGQKIFRQPDLESIRTRILKEAQQANISSAAWEVQTPVSKRNKVINKSDLKEQLKEEISKTIHPDAQRNLGIDIYNSSEDLKNTHPLFSKDDNIIGAYNPGTGRISLFADKINKDEVHSIVMHETVHMARDKGGWKAVFGKDSDNILEQIKRNITNDTKDEWVQAQKQARDAGTPKEDLLEETISYFLQNRDNAKTGTFQKIKRAIAGFLYRAGIKTEITDDVIHNMADRMLKDRANGRSIDRKSTVKAIKFAKKKAKETEDHILQDEDNVLLRVKDFINGNKKFFGDKAIGEKRDLNMVEHVLGTTMFNAEHHGGAYKRLYKNVLNKTPEHKLLKQNELRNEGDYSLFEPSVNLKKKHPSLYRRVMRDVIKKDIDAYGYTVKKNENTELYEIYDPEGKQVSEPMMSFDKAYRTAFDLEAENSKLTDIEKEVLINHRKMVLKLYHHYADTMNEIIRQHEIAGVKVPKVTIIKKGKPVKISLKTAMMEMGNRVGYYFPRIRQSGDWKIEATKKGIPSEVKFFKTKFGARQYKAQMIRRGYKTTFSESGTLSEDIYQTLAPLLAQEQVINKALGKMSTSENFDVNMADLFVKQYAAVIKSHGSRSRMIGRSDAVGTDVKRGYETDLVRAMAGATDAAAGGWAKQQAAINGLRTITGKDLTYPDYLVDNPDATYKDYLKAIKERGIDASKEHRAYREATAALRDVLKNNEFADNVIASLKSATVVKYLGGRVSSAAFNTTNMVLGVPGTLAGELEISIPKAFKAIGSAGKEYLSHRLNKKTQLTPLFKEIEKRGLDTPQFNREAVEALQTRTEGAYRWIVDKSMYMFGTTERINRAWTIAANYKAIAKKAGKPLFKNGKVNEEWLEQAVDISNHAHGDYGKSNRMYVSRGNNIGAQTLQAYSVFMTFSQTYLQEMARLGLVKKQYAPALYMALSGALIGGVGATVPMGIAKAIAKFFNTDDPEEAMIKALGGSDFVRYGLPTGIGLSTKGTLAMRFEPPEKFIDLFGAPGGLVEDVFDGLKNISQGFYEQGAEKILPTAFGSPLRALRERNQGVTTRSGSAVFFGNKQIKANDYDTLLRFFSFNPTNIDKKKAILYSEYSLKKRYNEYKRELNKRYKMFYLNPPENRDKNDLINLYADMRDFNKELRDKGIIDIVSPVTLKTLHATLRRALRPSKRERLR